MNKLLVFFSLIAIFVLSSHAELVGTNLSFEGNGTAGTAGWTVTSLGSNALESDDFRGWAGDGGASAFLDSSAGNYMLLMDMNLANAEVGRLSQQLSGTAEEGTYTWSVYDVGLATFGDNGGGSFTYGFSTDGTSFISGSSATFVEGTSYYAPGAGSAASGSVSYDASGLESALYIMFETGVNASAVRTVSTVGYTELGFEAIPEPATIGLVFGMGLVALLRKRMGR